MRFKIIHIILALALVVTGMAQDWVGVVCLLALTFALYVEGRWL